ncbi:hypothetical protein [Halovivax sp.]|uniref:hypothetical protein n=1 Tax=Halovivax sp. TaxID=1935978 RepID=UPI0025BB9EBA|nr:hypothetical protein [Halovivax sp.]
MTNPLPRRRLIQVGGAGTAASLAGCLSTFGSDDDTNDAENAALTDDEPTVALAVNVDEEEFEQIQADVFERVEDGDIDQGEAQAEMEEAQTELIGDAVAAFESRAEETDGLAVADVAGEIGLALVEGETSALIEALAFDEVAALLPPDEFETA